MNFSFHKIKIFALFCVMTITLAACGYDSNTNATGSQNDFSGDLTPEEPAPRLTTITGTVTAPAATVTSLESNSTIYKYAFNFLITPSYADIIGLQPVGNGTAELIEIDDDGNQVGDVLATAPLSITGEYSLSLPSGRALAANLIIRITSGSLVMRAMVVEEVVDINPISEFVLQKFIDDETLTLADLPVGQVISLRGRVEEFDLTAEADLTSMLAKLEADLGELVDTEIEEIGTIPDDGTLATATAGTWNTVELGLGLHDSEDNSSGTLNTGIFSATNTIAVDSSDSSALTVSEASIFIDSFTNLSFGSDGVWNLYNETLGGTAGEGELFTGSVASDGTITVSIPFEEELQSGDCPSVGWRYPPLNQKFDDTGNGNALINVNAEASIRYNLTDTNSDQCGDAVNPDSKDGDESSVEMLLALKAGGNMSAADVSGDYGFVTLYSELSSSNNGIIVTSTVGEGNFDGVDTIDVPADSLHELGFGRFMGSTPGTANLGNEAPPTDGGFGLPYTIASDGKMFVNNGSGLDGWVNADGSIFGLLDIQEQVDGTVLFGVNQEIMIGVRLPSSAPSLGDTVYRLYPMLFGAGDNGYMEISTLSRNNSLTFNAAASTAVVTGKIRGFELGSETGNLTSIAEDDTVSLLVQPAIANGAISMTFEEPGSTTYIDGYVSEDSSVIILRLYEEGTNDRLVGIIVGVKQ